MSVIAQPRLGTLNRSECFELLGQQEVGRLAFTSSDGPRIHPVNYVIDNTTIVIRTSPYAELSEHTVGAVALEIDEIDRSTHRGWSVLVVGDSTPIDDPDETIRLRRSTGLEAWAPDQRTLFIRIAPRASLVAASCD